MLLGVQSEFLICAKELLGTQAEAARYIRSKEDILKSLGETFTNDHRAAHTTAPDAVSQPQAAPAPARAPAAEAQSHGPAEARKATTLRPGFLTGGSRPKEVVERKPVRPASHAIVLDYPDGAAVEFDRFSNGRLVLRACRSRSNANDGCFISQGFDYGFVSVLLGGVI